MSRCSYGSCRDSKSSRGGLRFAIAFPLSFPLPTSFVDGQRLVIIVSSQSITWNDWCYLFLTDDDARLVPFHFLRMRPLLSFLRPTPRGPLRSCVENKTGVLNNDKGDTGTARFRWMVLVCFPLRLHSVF